MKNEALDNSVVTLCARGWAARRIARELGISRNRVKRILLRQQAHRNEEQPPVPKPSPRASKLDPHKDLIKELLQAFTTPPTCQRGQHDWSEYAITFTASGQTETVIFFSFILSYSRRQYLDVVPDKTQTTLLRALINAFVYFAGVPKEIESDNRTTRRKPIDMYQEELPHLQPLPKTPVDTSRVVYRIVNREACIEYDGYFYAAPPSLLFESCPVRITHDEVLIYSPACELVALHKLAEEGRTDRYVGRPQPARAQPPTISMPEVISRLETFGPANNLVLVAKQSTERFARFTMLDRHTKRTYLLYDFNKAHHLEPNLPYVVTGKINAAHNRLFLVLETSRLDRKQLSSP